MSETSVPLAQATVKRSTSHLCGRLVGGASERRSAEIVPDANRLWPLLGRHGARLYGGTERFVGWTSTNAFANLTGEPNLDLNIACLFGAADGPEAIALLEVVDRVGAPTVLPVSPTVVPGVAGLLIAAGFVPVEATEALMWRPPIASAPHTGTFDVRRAANASDLAAAGRVLAEAHGTADDVVERVFGLGEWRSGQISCWIARDGPEPVSIGWLTLGDGFVGVWEMMTSPRHRRRGAGRAALTTGLAHVIGAAPEGAFLWASPLGRPLYRALGFEVVEEVTVWLRGGTPEELAMIGVVPPGTL